MKRQIRFRAKDITAGGTWVYGSLITDGKAANIVSKVFTQKADWHTVDPDTVGQYTGLEDYNGVDIYEGDIVNISQYDMPERAIIKFKRGSFVLACDGKIIDSVWGYDPDMFEVIGNIHDNPTLLKEDEQ